MRVLEVLGMSRVRSLKMMPWHHFGNFGAGPRQPMIFGLRGTARWTLRKVRGSGGKACWRAVLSGERRGGVGG